MPKISKVPEGIKPYRFHGVELEENGKEAIGDCPFCGREGKLSVKIATGTGRCLVCSTGNKRGGINPVLFVRRLYEMCDEIPADYSSLVKDRGLARADTPVHWGVVKHAIRGDWAIAGYGADREINQLYRYVYDRDKERMVLLPTPGLGGQLFGLGQFNKSKPIVFLCEGPWDGMALWETLGATRADSSGDLVFTGNQKRSLLADANVVAVAGCGAAGDQLRKFQSLFSDKVVHLCFDNDHPRPHPRTGQPVAPAGLEAARRAARIMSEFARPPKEINYLRWGAPGYDLEQPHGYDVRDLLGRGELSERVEQLAKLSMMLTPVPSDWLGKQGAGGNSPAGSSNLIECQSYDEMIEVWKQAMVWTDGLDYALSCMLSAAMSTMTIGDQLWLKIIGPAACGKSTLMEALAVNKAYTISKSTIRGFHSGFKSDSAGSEDNSLLALCAGKTLLTKDGDTLLKAPNKDQILAEGRDVYDRVSRTHYRNRMSRDYEGLSMTWILAGTSALRAIDSSELGARFLDCVIMERIDDDLEDKILLRVVQRADENMSNEVNGQPETQYDEHLGKAMAMTGGYLGWLRENCTELLSGVNTTPEQRLKCARYGKFVAFARARPSRHHEEAVEREFATRLASQHIRLAKGLAAVMNRDTLDPEVMRRVRRVALDTARGIGLELIECLSDSGEEGADARSLALQVHQGEDRVKSMLRFMRRIEAVETFEVKTKKTMLGRRVRWRLTGKMQRLYNHIMEDA